MKKRIIVIKKSSKKQKFSAEKIKKSIDEAAKEANISKRKREEIEKEILKKVFKIIENRGVITTAEIRDLVLIYLKKEYMPIFKTWMTYEALKMQRRAMELQ